MVPTGTSVILPRKISGAVVEGCNIQTTFMKASSMQPDALTVAIAQHFRIISLLSGLTPLPAKIHAWFRVASCCVKAICRSYSIRDQRVLYLKRRNAVGSETSFDKTLNQVQKSPELISKSSYLHPAPCN